MIRVKRIHIEEFRGIRLLDLDLCGNNFGICGSNGTGKSGVVDAIEFCLTGNITRLSGQGAGGLTIKNHAPHIDQRNSPEKAKVTINASIPSLGLDVTITRSVKNPRSVSVTPANPPVEVVVRELQSHPEFALSRREIAKYIVTPAAQRSADVQNLLRLEHINDLRMALRSYVNKCKYEANETDSARSGAENELKTALGLKTIDCKKVVEKTNEQRRILGMPNLTELTPTTSFKGAAQEKGNAENKPIIVKDVAVADLTALVQTICAEESDGFLKGHQESALSSLNMLKEDEKALSLARRHGFITTGLDFVTDDACPLCDKPWDADELREHLKQKLLNVEAIGTLLDALGEDIDALLGGIEARVAAIQKAASYSAALDPAVSREEFDSYMKALGDVRTALKGFQNDNSMFDEVLAAVEAEWWVLPSDSLKRLDETQKAVKRLPDRSARDNAIGFLTELQVRYDQLTKKTAVAKSKASRSAVAKKIYDHYNDISNKVLERIYDAVAKEFTEYYKAINGDESKFISELKAEPAKLSFNVDFYGRGTFPPGAYHSEGHQDGMGLCLYLALMNHTLGDKFTFAVLDDVLMSIDTGHRREVCRLLKTKFPHTQFILTTHDRVWLQYMKTEGLIKNSQIFGGWNVETGPRIWDDIDIWTEIENALGKDDVPRAAALLRRYLEYLSAVLADNLRAKVEYRGDANYDLGDLLSPVLNQWKDRLKKGVETAKHWGHHETKDKILGMLAEAKELINKSEAERWAINKSVHFNEWENFTKGEFREVANAFKALLGHIRCTNHKCGGYPYLTPRKGSSEQLRCSCQAININLKMSI